MRLLRFTDQYRIVGIVIKTTNPNILKKSPFITNIHVIFLLKLPLLEINRMYVY